jgi:hypothetical protein
VEAGLATEEVAVVAEDRDQALLAARLSNWSRNLDRKHHA